METYCVCTWSALDDGNDTHFKAHVRKEKLTKHCMCSYREWKLHVEIKNKDRIIQQCNLDKENVCSDTTISLQLRVKQLEHQLRLLEEKLNVKEEEEYVDSQASGRTTNRGFSRLSSRRARG